MTAKQIRNFIIKNKKDTALLIGNGINRYAETGCSWDTLLKALAKVYCPNLCFEQLPTGISNTEFFDLLEISYLKDIPIFDKEEFEKQRVSLSMPRETLDRISESIQNYALRTPVKLTDLNQYKEAVQKSSQELSKLSETIDFNFISTIASMGNKKFSAIVRNKFIATICAYMKKWEYQPLHQQVALFAHKYHLPILTTNYDTLLEDSVNAREHNYKHESSSENFPISLSYTNDTVSDYNAFGIWHVNGVIHYPKSILIGLTHYMRAIEYVRNLLFPPNKFDAEIIQNQWNNPVKDTWIDILLSKHLVILGLSLDKDETLLRWLLIQRAKFYAMFHYTQKRGFYIVPESEALEDGKVLFFKTVGIDVVRVKDYESVYKIISA